MKKIIILIMLMFCSGCFNYNELNELGIVSAISISKSNEEFTVDLQIINILESGENGLTESPITVISGKGKTILDAIRSLNLQSSKIFFSPDIEYVILDKSVISNDLSQVIDFLARDTKLSLNFLVVTSLDSSGKEILSSLSQFNTNSANNLAQIVNLSQKRYGASYSLSFLEYLKNYLEPGINSVLPNIVLHDNDKKSDNIDVLQESDTNSYIEIENLVTFNKKGKPITLSKNQAFGYNFLKNQVRNASITCKCGDDYFTVETLKSKFSYQDKLNKNKINIKGDVSGEIVYYGCKQDLNNKKDLEEINKIFESELESYVKDTINLAKSEKLDFIGIGNYIYKNNYKYFDFENKDWDSEGLNKIDFDYDIKASIFKEGNLKGDL